MKLLVITFLLTYAPYSVFAQGSASVRAMHEGLKKLQDLNRALTMNPECNPSDFLNPVSCSAITDNFCAKLWDSEHRGSMKLFDGQIAGGVTGKSEMSRQRMADYRALLDNAASLPQDLREKTAPILAELSASLEKERDEDSWYKEVSLIKQKFSLALSELARERAKAARPELKNIKDEDLTIEQMVFYRKKSFQLSDEVLTAKYAKSANWKRVEVLYPKVQKNLMAEISKLYIPADRKEMMLKRVAEAELTLPYLDPDKSSASEACGSTEVNAFYSGSNHRFVVCAGLFNSYQSPSALALVIAHEIGHGIDSESLAQADWNKTSPLAATLQKLAHSKGPAYDCAQWKAFQGTVFKRKDEIKLRDRSSLDKLYSCLMSHEDLKEFTTDNVRTASEMQVRSDMSSAASAYRFTNLTQHTFKKFGEVKVNETYLRPDMLDAKRDGYFDETSIRDPSTEEIFVQSLSCQEAEENGKTVKHAEASLPVRQQLFGQALKETAEILKAQNEDYFSYCGQNCHGLTFAGLSVNPRENNADWFGFRAYSPLLEQLPYRHRAEASAAAMALFCGEPDVTTDAPELTKKEKEYSLETHPDDRIRRVSFFIPANAEAVGCKVDENDKGYATCEP